jgi:hypothetical protein
MRTLFRGRDAGIRGTLAADATEILREEGDWRGVLA